MTFTIGNLTEHDIAKTIDALLDVMNLGVTPIGATATEAMILDFRARTAGEAAAAIPADTTGY